MDHIIGNIIVLIFPGDNYIWLCRMMSLFLADNNQKHLA